MKIENYDRVKEIVNLIVDKKNWLENLFSNKEKAQLILITSRKDFKYELTDPCFNYIQNQLKMRLEKEIKELTEELEKL
jgi:hypothetical protein